MGKIVPALPWTHPLAVVEYRLWILDKVQMNVTVYFACIYAIPHRKPQHIEFGLFKLSHSFHGFLNLI